MISGKKTISIDMELYNRLRAQATGARIPTERSDRLNILSSHLNSIARKEDKNEWKKDHQR